MTIAGLTTFVGGAFFSAGMYNHFKPMLPQTIHGLPKSAALAGIVGLTFLGFHVAGKIAEGYLPSEIDESYLKTAIRPLGQIALGVTFTVAQIALLEFSGILLDERGQLIELLRETITNGNLTPDQSAALTQILNVLSGKIITPGALLCMQVNLKWFIEKTNGLSKEHPVIKAAMNFLNSAKNLRA